MGGKVSKQSHWDWDIVCLSFVMKTQISVFVLFFFFFFLSDGRNELPELQSSSIIRPHDQRGPLSSTENFKTNNNKHFEKSAEPPGAGLYLPPSCPLTTSGVSRWRVSYFYLLSLPLLNLPSWKQTSTRSLCLWMEKKKKIVSIKLFHLPPTSHLAGIWHQSQRPVSDVGPN